MVTHHSKCFYTWMSYYGESLLLRLPRARYRDLFDTYHDARCLSVQVKSKLAVVRCVPPARSSSCESTAVVSDRQNISSRTQRRFQPRSIFSTSNGRDCAKFRLATIRATATWDVDKNSLNIPPWFMGASPGNAASWTSRPRICHETSLDLLRGLRGKKE